MKSKHIVFFSTLTILSTLILLLNFKFTSIVEHLYVQGGFETLNSLVNIDVNQNRSFDYYVGKIEDVWVGPMTNFIGHMLFAVFCLLYLKDVSARIFCLWVFIFLVVTKFNVLFYPPYGDAIGGPFAEAMWLADHNFDYMGLYHQPGYNDGGPRVYLFSAYPTYLAILLKMIPLTKIFLVINHLMVYLFSSVIVTLTRCLMVKDAGNRIATLVAVVLLALPLFQSQSEAINMEMPCLFFSIISIYYLSLRRMGWASLFAFMAVLVKGHGIIICATVGLVNIFLFCTEDKDRQNRWFMLLYGFLAVLGALGKVATKFFLKDQHASAGMMSFLAGWPSLKHMNHTYVYAVSLMIFCVIILWKAKGIRNLFVLIWDKYYTQVIVFITAGMWYLVFLNFYAVSPRYMLELAPFLIMCLVSLALLIIKNKTIIYFTLIGVIGFASLASYGFSYKGQGTNYHVLTEKNLQYRNDLKLNMRMTRIIEKYFSQFTIGAPFIITQMLVSPRLGYVTKPHQIILYNMFMSREGLKNYFGYVRNFPGLNKLDIRKTLWVAPASEFIKKNNLNVFPWNKHDKIIQHMELGDNKATLFMGGNAIERKRLFVIQQLKL